MLVYSNTFSSRHWQKRSSTCSYFFVVKTSRNPLILVLCSEECPILCLIDFHLHWSWNWKIIGSLPNPFRPLLLSGNPRFFRSLLTYWLSCLFIYVLRVFNSVHLRGYCTQDKTPHLTPSYDSTLYNIKNNNLLMFYLLIYIYIYICLRCRVRAWVR